eukprot:SAG31_NODE_2552_length_5509_cov_3.954898_2_plen_394_part_00
MVCRLGSISLALRHGSANRPDVVEELCRQKADASILVDGEQRYLDVAVSLGCEEVAAVLVQHGSAVDKFDLSGRTGLHRAADNDEVRAVAMWLKLGADPELEVQLPSRRRALHLAAAMNHDPATGSLLQLVQFGVDVNASDSSGATALHLALLRPDSDLTAEQKDAVAVLLCASGASIDGTRKMVSSAMRNRLKQLQDVYLHEQKNQVALEKSHNAQLGAQALAARGHCSSNGEWRDERGGAWAPYFCVLIADDHTPTAQLHLFDKSTATQPQRTVVLRPIRQSIGPAPKALTRSARYDHVLQIKPNVGVLALRTESDHQRWLTAFDAIGFHLDDNNEGANDMHGTQQIMNENHMLAARNLQQVQELNDNTEKIEDSAANFLAAATALAKKSR